MSDAMITEIDEMISCVWDGMAVEMAHLADLISEGVEIGNEALRPRLREDVLDAIGLALLDGGESTDSTPNRVVTRAGAARGQLANFLWRESDQIRNVLYRKLDSMNHWARMGRIVVVPDRTVVDRTMISNLPISAIDRPWPWDFFAVTTSVPDYPLCLAARSGDDADTFGSIRLFGLQAGRGEFADSSFAVIPLARRFDGKTFEEMVESFDVPVEQLEGRGSLAEAHRAMSEVMSILVFMLSDDSMNPDREPARLSDRAARRRRERELGNRAASVQKVGWRTGQWIRAQDQRDASDRSSGDQGGPSRAAHWRRGHFRVFLGGPGRSELKRTWVKPHRVGAGGEVGRIVQLS